MAAMSLIAEPLDGGCRLVTETRVFATDEAARRAFKLYWLVIRTGSGVIRRVWLGAAKRRAEGSGWQAEDASGDLADRFSGCAHLVGRRPGHCCQSGFARDLAHVAQLAAGFGVVDRDLFTQGVDQRTCKWRRALELEGRPRPLCEGGDRSRQPPRRAPIARVDSLRLEHLRDEPAKLDGLTVSQEVDFAAASTLGREDQAFGDIGDVRRRRQLMAASDPAERSGANGIGQ